MKTTEKIIAWFEENKDVFNDCIEELDSYNGYLGDDRYYCMEELDEFFNDTPAVNLLNMAFFGRDDETWNINAHGEKEYGSFNPNREYFYFNGYGNLVSADYKDYTGFIDEYVVESMAENRNYICTISENEELSSLFDELEEKSA